MSRPSKKKSQIDRKSYHNQSSGSRFCPTPKSLVQAVQELQALRPDLRLWLLRGNLGAGKTTVVRGILRGFGVKRSVTSPTYTLRQEYPIPKTTRRLIHVDAYRLRTPDEARGIGLLDDLHDPDALLWIEWPERLDGLELPPAAHLEITVEKTGRRLSWMLPAAE